MYISILYHDEKGVSKTELVSCSSEGRDPTKPRNHTIDFSGPDEDFAAVVQGHKNGWQAFNSLLERRVGPKKKNC